MGYQYQKLEIEWDKNDGNAMNGAEEAKYQP
jgi:hypothetical protein